jgi:gluconate 2-dehydrogenase gamma chain
MSHPNRRELLASTAAALLASSELADAEIIKGALPWKPGSADPPDAAGSGPWQFFTAEEAQAIEALVDRLIPPDPETPGGKDVGCAIFIDRQLAGGYGRSEGLYRSGPFLEGTKAQGAQSPHTPAEHYRQALAALDRYCRRTFDGKPFADLPDASKDELITGLERGTVQLGGLSSQDFFELILRDTHQGFFADPVYGGNKDMAAWKMIGFPGARYDYRDWVERHNERFPLPPVGIKNHPSWSK